MWRNEQINVTVYDRSALTVRIKSLRRLEIIIVRIRISQIVLSLSKVVGYSNGNALGAMNNFSK